MDEFSYEEWLGSKGLKTWERAIVDTWALDQLLPFVICLFNDVRECDNAEDVWDRMASRKRWGVNISVPDEIRHLDWEHDIDWQAMYNIVFERKVAEKGLETFVDKWGAYGFIHPEDGPVFGDRSGSYPIWDEAFFEERMQW